MKIKKLGIIGGIVLGLCPITVQASQPQINEFTYEEAQELMQIATAEAGDQGEDGMFFVMSCIVNRVDSSEFPDNLHDVIYEPHQFYTKGMNKTKIPVEAHLALARIESGEVAKNIVAFETSNYLDKYFDYAFTYRDHKFYIKKED